MSDAPDSDAMLTRLRSRRTAPGMIDLEALLPGTRQAGLGLGASGLVRQLRGRLSGDGMPAVAAGELILARPEDPAEMPDGAMVPRATAISPARPRAAASPPPVAASADAADGATAPAPVALEAFDAVSPDHQPGPAAALPVRRAHGGFTGGGAATGLPWAAGIDATPAIPDGAAGAPPLATDAAASLVAVAELRSAPPQQPSLALPRVPATASGPTAAALPGTPVGAARSFADSMEAGGAYAPAAAYAQPAASAPAQAAFPVAAPAVSAPFEDLSERVVRDLRRRLAVERERQGRPRWKD